MSPDEIEGLMQERRKRRKSRRHEYGWGVYEIDEDGPMGGVCVYETWDEDVARNRVFVLNKESRFQYQVRRFKNT